MLYKNKNTRENEDNDEFGEEKEVAAAFFASFKTDHNNAIVSCF